MLSSIYFSQTENSTYFSIKAQYSNEQLINNVGFIHKNTWEILDSNYTILNNTKIYIVYDNNTIRLDDTRIDQNNTGLFDLGAVPRAGRTQHLGVEADAE